MCPFLFLWKKKTFCLSSQQKQKEAVRCFSSVVALDFSFFQRGGKDITVTIHDLEEYVKVALACHYTVNCCFDWWISCNWHPWWFMLIIFLVIDIQNVMFFALIKSHEKKSWNLDPRFWVTQVSLISRRKVDGNKQNRYLLIFCVSIHLFQLVVQWTLVTGVRRQMDALREGFNSVLPLSNLTSFSYTEVICLY